MWLPHHGVQRCVEGGLIEPVRQQLVPFVIGGNRGDLVEDVVQAGERVEWAHPARSMTYKGNELLQVFMGKRQVAYGAVGRIDTTPPR